jgi:hypothetical protein
LYSLFRQRWNVAVTPYEGTVVAGLLGCRKQRQALDELQWMTESADGFAADPFIAPGSDEKDEYLIFYEYFPWRSRRGQINCVPVTNAGFGKSVVSFRSPHHLSYPYTLFHEGGVRVVPEHATSQNLCMYQTDRKGYFQGVDTLAGGLSIVDGTIIHLNDTYWMFGTHLGVGDNVDLYIYHSPKLTGPWIPHARNPVKSDRSNARPAGHFIRHSGSLFRPAQDCSSHYGAGIVVNEVKTLDKENFEEDPVCEIRPTVGSHYDYGLHTISSCGDYTAIDGARLESSLHPSFDSLSRYLKVPAR